MIFLTTIIIHLIQIKNMLFFIINIITHSHSHSHGQHFVNNDDHIRVYDYITFNYRIATIKSHESYLATYFITNNFIHYLENNHNYNYNYNETNYSSYNIYYYYIDDNTKCIYYYKKLNDLDYTYIDYSNINIINNTKNVNLTFVNARYCVNYNSDNYYDKTIIIIVIFMLCCFICCYHNPNNNRELY